MGEVSRSTKRLGMSAVASRRAEASQENRADQHPMLQAANTNKENNTIKKNLPDRYCTQKSRKDEGRKGDGRTKSKVELSKEG